LEKKIVVVGLTVVAVAVMLLVTLLASGALISSKTVASTGIITITNIGVYSDSACTQSLNSINWGTISPGNSATRTIYVKNLGTTEVTLSMSRENWTPANADGPITLTWNQQDVTIASNEVATATLTLRVSSSVSGISSFSVDIVISGTG
jgi:hypothetical protein